MSLQQSVLLATHTYVREILDDPDLAREVGDALIVAARNRERFPGSGEYTPSRVALNVIKARFPLDVDESAPAPHTLVRDGATWMCGGTNCNWHPLLGESVYASFDQHLREVRST